MSIPAVKDQPLLAVVTAQALAITLYYAALSAGLLCVLLLAWARPRPKFIFLGLMLGLAACWLAPGWVETGAELKRLEGRVVAAGFIKGRYALELEDLRLEGRAVSGRASLNLKRGSLAIDPGARIAVKFAGIPLRPNLSGFDYRRHLLAKGICLKGEIGSPADIDILEPGRRNGFRDHIERQLASLARPEAEILLAALLGRQGALAVTSLDRFNSLGITHLIAISGFNFALVMLWGYLLVYQLCRLASLRFVGLDSELAARMGGLIAIGLYWLVVEPEVATVRAAIMAVCVLVALVAGRRLAPLALLALAAVLVLLRWPLALFAPGFLLSFGAVYGMLAWAPWLSSRSRLAQYFWVSLLAGLYTLPVVLRIFGFTAPLALFWNLALVPLYSFVVLPLGYAWLVAETAGFELADWLLHASLTGIELTLNLARTWGWLWPAGRPSLALSLIMACALIVLPLSVRRELALRWLAPFMIVAAIWGCGPRADEGLRLALLPAGSNATVLAECHGSKVLFGGGSQGFARHELAPWLLERGIRRLDLLIMPRPVAAEAGGLAYILSHFEVGELWVNVGQHRGSVYDDVLSVAKKKSVAVRVVARGDLVSEKDFIIEVLNPRERQVSPLGKLDPDLHSIVIAMRDKHFQTMIIPRLDLLAQQQLAFGESLPGVLVQTAHQELDGQSLTGNRPVLVLTSQAQGWTAADQLSWREATLVEVGHRPNGLLVKLGSFKADGYHERVLTVPVARGVSDEQ